MNPLTRPMIGKPIQKPQAKPMTPVEAAAEMLKQRQKLMQQNSGPVGFTARNDTQTDAQAQQPQKPGIANPLTSAVGTAGTTYAASQLMNGGGSAPAMPTGLTGTNLGATAPRPAMPNVVNGSPVETPAFPLWSSGSPASVATPTVISGEPVAAGGSGYLGGTGAAGGALGTSAAYAGGAYTGAQQAGGAAALIKNQKPNLIQSASLFPFDGGATLAANLAGKVGVDVPFGHTKNFYDGKTRGSIIDQLTQNSDTPGTLNLGNDDHPFTVTKQQFQDDPTTYNRSVLPDGDNGDEARQKDTGIGQALAFAITGQKPGDTAFVQTANLIANAHAQGVSAQEIAQHLGYDYNAIRKKIDEGKLSQEDKDALYNGLDQTFGVNAYASKAPESSGGGKKKKGSSKGSSKDDPAPAIDWNKPAPTYPGTTSGTQPHSEQDYIQAIMDVNSANTSDAEKEKKKLKGNPLGRSIYR